MLTTKDLKAIRKAREARAKTQESLEEAPVYVKEEGKFSRDWTLKLYKEPDAVFNRAVRTGLYYDRRVVKREDESNLVKLDPITCKPRSEVPYGEDIIAVEARDDGDVLLLGTAKIAAAGDFADASKREIKNYWAELAADGAATWGAADRRTIARGSDDAARARLVRKVEPEPVGEAAEEPTEVRGFRHVDFRDGRKAPACEKLLERFMLTGFEADGLRRMVRFGPDSQSMVHALPEVGVSRMAIVASIIEGWRRRGWLSDTGKRAQLASTMIGMNPYREAEILAAFGLERVG